MALLGCNLWWKRSCLAFTHRMSDMKPGTNKTGIDAKPEVSFRFGKVVQMSESAIDGAVRYFLLTVQLVQAWHQSDGGA